MDVLFGKLAAQILFWVYDFLDLLNNVFRVFAGLDCVDYEGNRITLLEAFMNSAVFSKGMLVILGLVIIGVIIAAACVSVKIFKGMFDTKSNNNKTALGVAGQGAKSVILMIASLMLVVLFIAFVNMILQGVDVVMTQGNQTTLSNSLFQISVETTYEYEESEEEATDEYGQIVYETDENGERKPVMRKVYIIKKDGNGNPVMHSGWYNGVVNDIDFARESPDTVFGVRDKDILGFEHSDWLYQKDKEPIVQLQSFNFLTAYLSAGVMTIAMIMAIVGLTKRLYDIMVLIFMMPLVIGTIPLDDGARMKAWCDTMFSKAFLALGVIMAINVYFLCVPVIGNVVIYTNSVFDSTVTNVVRLFLYIGGALCINTAQTLIARVLGTSADESREMAQSFRTLASTVMLGGSALRGAKNVAFGGYGKYGRYHRGLLPGVAGGVNAVGAKLGGDKYTNSTVGRFMGWASRPRDNGYNARGAYGGQSGQGGQGGQGGGAINAQNNGLGSAPNAISQPQTTSRTSGTGGALPLARTTAQRPRSNSRFSGGGSRGGKQ